MKITLKKYFIVFGIIGCFAIGAIMTKLLTAKFRPATIITYAPLDNAVMAPDINEYTHHAAVIIIGGSKMSGNPL